MLKRIEGKDCCYVVTMAFPSSTPDKDFIVIAKNPIAAIEAATKMTAARNGLCTQLRLVRGTVVIAETQ